MITVQLKTEMIALPSNPVSSELSPISIIITDDSDANESFVHDIQQNDLCQCDCYDCACDRD